MTFKIITPHTKGAGYYKNDDTPSGGKITEADIRTCTHCQAIIKMQDWKEDGNFCGKCMAPVCHSCGDRMETMGCEPFIKRLEEALEGNYRKAQFRKIAGLEGEYIPVIFSGQT